MQLYIVFLEPRFSENSSPFGTNNSRGQISWHIFAPKGRHSLYNQKFKKLQYLLKIKRAKWPEKFAFRQKTMPFVPQVKIFNPMSNTLTSLEIKNFVKYLG